MGKIQTIEVNFGSQSVFKPGDALSGSVVLTIAKQVKVKAVKAKLHGYCKTKWTVEHSSDDVRTYKEKEDYVLQEVTLWGNNEPYEFYPGRHEKPISFSLPTECPSSFKSKHGDVVYSVTVTCVFPGFSIDDIHEKILNVVNMENITENPATNESFYQPLQAKAEEDSTFCCCCSTNAKVDLTIDKSAYAPGNTVYLNGFVENGSNSQMDFYVVLVQKVTCYGRRSDFSLTSSRNLKSKVKMINLHQWKGQPIPRQSTKRFYNESSLTIPDDMIVSNLKNCNYIDVEYFIHFQVPVDDWTSISLDIDPLPVVMGFIPSDNTQTNILNAPPTNEGFTFGATFSQQHPASSMQTSFSEPPPPPSYNDALSFNQMQRT